MENLAMKITADSTYAAAVEEEQETQPATGSYLALESSYSPSTTTIFYTVPREQFTMNKGGIALTTMAGIVSFICSLMILNIIRMSNQKLSTTYHRIMVFMSIFDILSSVCFALSTLPMPSDDTLLFDGPMIGNKVTCQIQGYLVLIGLNGGASLYMCLSWYFVCKITFQFPLDSIRRKIEPLFYILTFLVAFTLPTFLLLENFIHTSPRSSFCVIAPDHSNCDYTLDPEFFVCDPKEYEDLLRLIRVAIGSIFSNIALIAIAMIIIIWTILNKTKSIKVALQEQEQCNYRTEAELDAYEDNILELRYTRVVVIQALMFIFAYLATWIFTLIPISSNLDQESIDVLLAFKSVLYPMQGFWNLIIFVYDKAYLAHRNDRNMALWAIIKCVLFYPPQTPELILPSAFMNVTIMGDRRGGHIELDEEIEVTNIILGREMGTRQKESFEDNSIGSSIRGFRNTSSPPESVSDEIQNSDFAGDSISNDSTDNTSKRIMEDSGFMYLGQGNKRFYMSSDGLRRTGEIED
jgi:hypothetical protein